MSKKRQPSKKLHCEECGKPFPINTVQYWKKFCSIRCGQKNWVKRHPRVKTVV